MDGTPEQLRQVVRLQAATGRLDGHIRLGDYLTFGYAAGCNQRFGQVHAVHQFTGGNFAGRGRADGFLNVTNLPHHRRELFGQQRYSVIVAFQGFIGREMLLDNLRTARNSGHGHMVAAFMPGIADQALADLGETVHIRQVHVFEGCRVGGLALQQGVGCARLAQQVHRVQDFFFAAHTGGYQHGQPA